MYQINRIEILCKGAPSTNPLGQLNSVEIEMSPYLNGGVLLLLILMTHGIIIIKS